VEAQISNIQRFSIHDGPGIRTTVFFQGCPLSCRWCHNPECISFEPSQGRQYRTDELMHEVMKDKVFFEESRGGVTFSGGEPLAQDEFLSDILKRCQEEKGFSGESTSTGEPCLSAT